MSGLIKEWLRLAGTVEEFEQDSLQRISDASDIPIEKVKEKFGNRPFGHMTDAWNRFTAELNESDELWFFSSPAGAFAKKMGCNGYAILRDGEIVETLFMMRT